MFSGRQSTSDYLLDREIKELELENARRVQFHDEAHGRVTQTYAEARSLVEYIDGLKPQFTGMTSGPRVMSHYISEASSAPPIQAAMGNWVPNGSIVINSGNATNPNTNEKLN